MVARIASREALLNRINKESSVLVPHCTVIHRYACMSGTICLHIWVARRMCVCVCMNAARCIPYVQL
jgi:hypothetical protein